MLRHVIPPTRFFSQTPNDIIRHPRLSGTAVRLLQWALSLAEGSRETIQSIGEKMPEGRITVRKARQQLEAEGFLHTRRFQHPETGHWTTRVLVSNVPLRTPAEIDAAFMAPGDRFRTVGERTGQAVGESPQEGNREEQNTSHPAEPDEPDEPATPLLARAARLLHGLGHREAKLRLGVAEAAKLAPLAERWLANGASELELRTALVSGLPPAVHSPVGFLTRRLTDKLPAPRRVTDPAAPALALPECAQCGDPLLPGQPAGLCTPCTGAVPPASEPAPAGLSGAALARAGIVRLSPRPRPPHRPRKGHKRQLIPSL